jgi:hypothetical protein
LPQHTRGLGLGAAGPGHIDGIVAKIRQLEFALQQSAIGMGIGAHPPVASRCKRLQFRQQATGRIEQRFRRIAAHPLFEQCKLRSIAARIGDRHLMGAPETFDLEAIDFFRPGPPLRAAQHDERPFRTFARFGFIARAGLNGQDTLQDRVQGVGHQPMHQLRHSAGKVLMPSTMFLICS